MINGGSEHKQSSQFSRANKMSEQMKQDVLGNYAIRTKRTTFDAALLSTSQAIYRWYIARKEISESPRIIEHIIVEAIHRFNHQNLFHKNEH